MSQNKLRVLVIEDSAYNRRTLVDILESAPDVTVVGTATDGEDGLRQALTLRPDVVTVDLEMPRIDGFTFLRLLLARSATPVIVVSGYSRKSDVFKALELGAFDFVAKPGKKGDDDLEAIREELLGKLRTVRMIRPRALARPVAEPARVAPRVALPLEVVGIGASTGGPPALQKLFAALPGDLALAVVVAQHMPEKFTAAFAERLHRHSAFQVAEAKGGEVLSSGKAYVAPGGRNLKVTRLGQELVLEVVAPAPGEKYLPCIDTLFQSLARAAGDRASGFLLTGMGSDGREGMLALKAAGARTYAESEETAVIYGMPKEAVEAGAVQRVLPLGDLIAEVVRIGRR